MNELNFKTKASGHYIIEIERSGVKRKVAEFDNLITNGGLDKMGGETNYLHYCQVGTGNTTPSFNDTALASYLAYTFTTNSSTGGAAASSPYYAYRTKVFSFAMGAVVGNIAEVGVGWAETGSLFSRALILDGSGNPATLTVLSDEILYVTYELRLYAQTSDNTGTVTIGETTYNWTSRPAMVNSSSWWSIDTDGQAQNKASSAGNYYAYNGVLGVYTALPSGTTGAASSASAVSYSAGTYVASVTVGWGLSNGNLSGGITAISAILGPCRYQISFSPAIPKDNTKVLSIVVSHSWARA